MTVGDLLRGEQPPPPSTRAAITAKFAKLETAFLLLYDGLNSVSEMLDETRALLDVDGDETHDVTDDETHDKPADDEPHEPHEPPDE